MFSMAFMRAFVDSTPAGVVLGLFLISAQCFEIYVTLIPVRESLSSPSSGPCLTVF